MKPFIKDMKVSQEIKNAGIEIQVNDNADKQMGDLFVTKTGLTWCRGKTEKANGVLISWEDFAVLMEDVSWDDLTPLIKEAKKQKKAKKAA